MSLPPLSSSLQSPSHPDLPTRSSTNTSIVTTTSSSSSSSSSSSTTTTTSPVMSPEYSATTLPATTTSTSIPSSSSLPHQLLPQPPQSLPQTSSSQPLPSKTHSLPLIPNSLSHSILNSPANSHSQNFDSAPALTNSPTPVSSENNFPSTPLASSSLPNQPTSNHSFPLPKNDKPRPHICLTCTRSFARLEHLKRHERSHTKEKPFECPQCSRCFARRDLLLRHQQKLHQLTFVPGSSGSGRGRHARRVSTPAISSSTVLPTVASSSSSSSSSSSVSRNWQKSSLSASNSTESILSTVSNTVVPSLATSANSNVLPRPRANTISHIDADMAINSGMPLTSTEYTSAAVAAAAAASSLSLPAVEELLKSFPIHQVNHSHPGSSSHIMSGFDYQSYPSHNSLPTLPPSSANHSHHQATLLPKFDTMPFSYPLTEDPLLTNSVPSSASSSENAVFDFNSVSYGSGTPESHATPSHPSMFSPPPAPAITVNPAHLHYPPVTYPPPPPPQFGGSLPFNDFKYDINSYLDWRKLDMHLSMLTGEPSVMIEIESEQPQPPSEMC